LPRKLEIQIVGDTRDLERALGRASHKTDSFGSSFAKLGKAALLTGGAVAGLATVIGVKAVKAAIDEQKQIAVLNAAFKAQGTAMRENSDQVQSLEAAGRKLGFADDEVRDGLTKLTQAGKTWKQSTSEIAVAQDLARAKGISLGEATAGLIKLQTGATRAAKQFGIVLPPITKAQDALKKSSVDLESAKGKELMAHAKIQDKLATGQAYYDTLAGKVKGTGDAFSKTAAGQLQVFKAALDDQMETLGTKLLPVMTRVLGWINAHWPEIEATVSAVATGIGAAVKGIQVAIEAIIPVVQRIVNWFRDHWSQISSITMEVLNTTKAIVMAFVGGILEVWSRFGGPIMSQVRALWDFIKNYIQGVINVIRGIINVVMGLIHGDWSQAWQGIKQIFSGVWQAIGAEIKYVWETIKNIIRIGLAALKALWQAEWAAVVAIAKGIWRLVVNAVSGGLGQVADAFRTAISTITGIGHQIMDGFLNGIRAGWQAVTGWLTKVPGFFLSLLGGAGRYLWDVGVRIMTGLLDGLKAGWNKVTGFLGGLGDSIVSLKGPPAKDAKLLVEVGGLIMQGLAAGLGRGFDKVKTQLTAASAILGKELTRALTESLSKAGKDSGDAVADGLSKSATKGLGDAGPAIIAAAKKYGIDAKAAIAVAMTEGGTSFGGPAGDKGTSFGPFQMHIGGANPYGDPQQASAFANSIKGIDYALRKMAEAGAKGLTGLAAIKQIVGGPGWGFERPANSAAEVAKAFGYFKELGPQVVTAITNATPQITAANVAQINQIAAIVKTGAKSIGLDHARQVVLGMLEGSPGIVAQAKAAMTEAVAAAKKAVVDARGSLTSAFQSLANDALAAFDQKWAGWKPKAQITLDKMQLQDQMRQAKDAITAAQKQLDDALAAQAALAPQEGETPEAFAARQAAAQEAVVTATKGLGDAKRAQVELNLQLEAQQQQKAHDARIAKQREHLAAQLLDLQEKLQKHPEQWEKINKQVLELLKKNDVPMFKAGQKFASQFADGLRDGIAEVAKAARALASALDKYVPHSPAKEGPLAYDVYAAGQRWSQQWAGGIGSGAGDVGAAVGSGLGGGGGGAGGMTVNVYGSVITERQLGDIVYSALLRRQGRNTTLGFT
jgi:phage-related protein